MESLGVGILGFGTVGSGVYEIFKSNSQIIEKRAGKRIEVKKILDVRDFSGHEAESLITNNFDDILNDPSINVVAEMMGGVEPAFTYAKKALEAGKSVVTSNKALVADRGAELIKTAKDNNVNFMFEASCGGTIPIIRPLNTSLTADNIIKIEGILNGTTNYILTKMTAEGRSFAEVLKDAQKLGYAEADPTADVEGYDACRKIAILSSIAFGGTVDYNDILTEGITKITHEDIEYAFEMGCVIKLIASSEFKEGGVCAKVTPCVISRNHPLSSVNNAFNAIFVKGDMSGETMYYGSGAGKLPTAAAVVGDIIDEVRNMGSFIPTSWDIDKKISVLSRDMASIRSFVRVLINNKVEAEKSIDHIFGKVAFIDAGFENEIGFVSGVETESTMSDKLSSLGQCSGVEKIINMIRMEE